MVSFLDDAFLDSIQQLIDSAFCSGFNPLSVLLGAAPPPPGFVRDNPYLAALLTPATCTPPIPPQETPFTGGQCVGGIYNMTVRTRRPDNGFLDVAIASIPGPILGTSNWWRLFPNSFDPGPYVYWRVHGPNIEGGRGFTEFGPISAFSDPGYAARSWIIDMVRVNGPDNCGDPPPGFFPPDQPALPPVRRTIPPTPINLPGFPNIVIGGSLTFRPAINLPIFGGVHIPVDVTINANAAVNIPVTFPVYLQLPSMRINAPISFNPRLDVNAPINVTIPGGGSDSCDCDDIREIVKEELDDKFPPSRPNSTITTTWGTAQSGVVPLQPFTETVDVVLQNIPVTARIQSGEDGPDVYYAGWYSFGKGANAGDRNPVHYQRNTYEVPVWANSFTFTLQEGYTATISFTYRQET